MRLSRPKTSLLSLAILAGLSAPALAQVKVDGVIDPAEWQGARHVTDFKMVQPFTQAATRHPTEAWILATPDGLAIAFRNTKIAGVETPRQRSARDQDVAIDRVNVMLDFDGDGRSGYDFTLTASDSIQDSTITGGGNFSSDWDGTWQHAVVDGAGEWTAELLIPWPYDEIYRWYLGMKICDANGETTKYANEAAKYNSYYQGYFNAYNQAYMPKQYATHFKL